VFGGESVRHMHKEVAKLEPDKAARKPIDDTLDQIDKEFKNLNSERAKLEKETAALLEQHDASAEQFRTFGARADAITASAGKNLLDLRFKLRSQLSDAQWRQLYPPSPPPPAQ